MSQAERRAHFFEPHLREMHYLFGNALWLEYEDLLDAPCGQRIQHTQRD